MKILKIGISSYEDMKARTKAIAKGEYKPSKNEPKIWFTSIESFAKILSEKNRMLLEIIAEEKPGSLSELTQLTGRQKSNLSRTLKTMEQYGLVELKKESGGRIVPHVPYDDVMCTFPITKHPYYISPIRH